MKAKTKSDEKQFDAVKIIRKIKEDISKDIVDMDYKQLTEYLAKNRLQSRN